MNGLLPLIMKPNLPSDEITMEFEYLKIEKHCFTSPLLHEEIDCPVSQGTPYHPKKERLELRRGLQM
ncbi:hypothetical protein Bca52824_034201 [Brassica carinata]|uniref:Zinc knuckle CX2CX4HX4C domain-containing protein n=1 Tax=Brassica carinata TaxID=52824 RepID=A0A8X7V6T6_BRACI|nr:hypothetical protein Bca52824_034201 [Brassica carinata]